MNIEVEEEEEKEEEDMDFNPFSTEDSPSEASSSSSPDDASPCDDIKSAEKLLSSSNRQEKKLAFCVGPAIENGEIARQAKFASDDVDGENISLEGSSKNDRDVSCTSPEQNSKVHNSSKENDASDQLMTEAHTTTSRNAVDTSKSARQTNNDDAISTRTRARHSLADYTLDELEAFLQESEGEDDLQNVDDEEEYRKFLAAVLRGGGDKGQTGQEDDSLDEDEENDADFIVELEEALETDTDETADNNQAPGNENEDFHIHRPETRQKKRLKESTEGKKQLHGQGKTPLRPILPNTSNPQISVSPSYGWQLSAQNFSHCSSSLFLPDYTIGFTVQQIGQLYCLIHEHIQLLLQVYSVCVLDPSHQEVATEVQKLINEMVIKHDQAISWRKVTYEISCFQPPNICASWQIDTHRPPGFSDWTPLIEKPICSILDVAPLRLVKDYMSDVSAIVLRHRHSHLEDPAVRLTLKKEPLFPSLFTASQEEIDEGFLGQVSTMSTKTASPLTPCQLQPKKSLAAALVESTKRQSVTLVPENIAKLAQRFYTLFNIALFPHKPPTPSVANRVLFTDAEDGLLAMGLMKYNNDWGAIQKHLLPCKSKHQIFVRQKNRSSSKAPENQIKAVRRMKMSPLTAEEKARIYEGLRVFRHDWLSIWKYFVPHRDPSLLQRQWRISTGTQKSYKKTEAIKEKRRLYEAQRRKMKSLKEVDNGGDSSGDEMEIENEAYVHEAFLADSEHSISSNAAQDDPFSSNCEINKQCLDAVLYSNTFCSWQSTPKADDTSQSNQEGDASSMLCASHSNYPLSHSVDARNYHRPNQQHSLSTNLRNPVYQLGSFETSKRKGARVIKLAPGLPPLNLPPSVRVISQSEFTNHQTGSCQPTVGKNMTRNLTSGSRVVSQAGSAKHIKRSLDTGALDSCQQMGSKLVDQYSSEQNASEADLEMHPLLFQTPEDRYFVNHSNTNLAYNFLPPVHLHNNLNTFGSQHLLSAESTSMRSNPREVPSDLSTIDFHPLLRRTDDASLCSRVGSSADLISGRAAQDNSAKLFSSLTHTMAAISANKNHLTTNMSSHCHYDEENNLDLDLRFCGMASKENTKDIKGLRSHRVDKSSRHEKEQHMVEKSTFNDKSLKSYANKFHDVAVASPSINHLIVHCENDPGTSQRQNNTTSGCTADPDDESSMQDIIMEKEELSDSEIESENIEFECEDLDDSSEEEWNSARPSDFEDQDISDSLALGENQKASNPSQQDESTSIRGIVEVGRNCNTALQTQTACHTKSPQLKPKMERSRRDKSSNSMAVLQSDNYLLTRTQKPKNSTKVQPSRPRQPHPRTGNGCKNITPRKHRRPSLCK